MWSDSGHPAVGDRPAIYQHVVSGMLNTVLFDTETAGRVPLRIEVYQQGVVTSLSEIGGNVDSGSGLSHDPFLICQSQGSRHATVSTHTTS